MKLFLITGLLLCLFVNPLTAQNSLSFEVVDGKTNNLLLRIYAGQKQANAAGISIKTEAVATRHHNVKTHLFSIKNTSIHERWVYLNWSMEFTSDAKIDNVQYWGGRGGAVRGSILLKNPSENADSNAAMLQAIYDKNRGIALALPPDQILTQFTQSLKHSNGRYFLHLQIPLVLDAGQADTFPIESYRFSPRYGFLDALQMYFLAHPTEFNPRQDIDPRAGGVGDASLVRKALQVSKEHAFEVGRRFYADWDWVYAPFKRTGDIYGRDQLWDYKFAIPSEASIAYFRNLPTAESYRAKRSEELKNINNSGVASAFYTPSFLYCEIELAKEKYSDAIIYNSDGSYHKYYTTPWVTGNDHEVLMYPWGNEFAKQSMEDAKQLVAENDISAFGYDVMGGGVAYRGTGMQQSPRRAFDDQGAYVDTTVAIAKMADFTRNLQKNGRFTGLVGNATGNARPFLITRSDSLMFEQPPYYHPPEFIALRYAAGHKMITLWNPWRLVYLLKWQDMTSGQLQEAYHGAADYLRLMCFRYGSFPSPRWASGVPQIMRMLPLLKSVISQGWQAVPAVRRANEELPDYIWPARYGSGLGSYITIGNAGKKIWQGQVVIDNDYLGTSNYLFVGVDTKILSQTVKGRTTTLQVQIPAHETLVLRAVAAIPESAAGNATVSWNDNGANGWMNIKSALAPTKVLAPGEEWKQVIRNAQLWNFSSVYFASPIKEILEFPFYNAIGVAQIALPRNASVADVQDARRLREYFRYWGETGVKPSRQIELSILAAGEKINAGMPVIYVGASVTKRQETILYVSDMKKLLNELDKKYFYPDVMNPGPNGLNVLKKARLEQGILVK